MAVTLRLARHGQKKRPFYRIVASEKESRRDGRFLEVVGFYNPMQNPASISLKEDKVRRWIEVGAETTDVVTKLIKKQMPGVLEARLENKQAKVREARRKRKERAKQRAA